MLNLMNTTMNADAGIFVIAAGGVIILTWAAIELIHLINK